MRYRMLIALGVGCGQMVQAAGGQPQPTQPVMSEPPSGDPNAGDGPGPPPPGSPTPEDPYAEPAPVPEAAPDSPYGKGSSGGKPPARRAPTAPSEAQALVDAHNRVRAKHCARPLAWSSKLAQVAQQWANALRDKGCMFGHSGGSYGENLAAGTAGILDPEAVVKMWYDEIALYKFPDGGFSMKTGHFTQVVWRGTTRVGCGRSQCKGMDIWVCEYDPAGNWDGQYRENVLPLGCR